MKNKVTAFLMELAVNPIMFRNFKSDPDSVLERTDVSCEEKAILKRSDPEEIRELIGKELGKQVTFQAIDQSQSVVCISEV